MVAVMTTRPAAKVWRKVSFGGPRTWFDLQGAGIPRHKRADLSRYVKEQIAPADSSD
jgi:hypothetical protein